MGGKLFVIEGVDGAGKQTQTGLAYDYLSKDLKRKTRKWHFPNYDKPPAVLIERYLAGEFGDIDAVPPEFVASAFAIERRAWTYDIESFLAKDTNNVVILDRYTASNAAHQGAKLKDRGKRIAFYEWLFRTERNDLRMPKPDKTVILFVPPEVTIQKIIARGGAADFHESDMDYQRNVAQAYKEICALYPDEFAFINCTFSSGDMRTREDIQADIRDAFGI